MVVAIAPICYKLMPRLLPFIQQSFSFYDVVVRISYAVYFFLTQEFLFPLRVHSFLLFPRYESLGVDYLLRSIHSLSHLFLVRFALSAFFSRQQLQLLLAELLLSQVVRLVAL